MAVGDLYRLSIHGRQEGQDVINVCYYETSALGSPTDSIVNITDAWRARVEAGWLAIHASTYTLIGLNTRKKQLPIVVQPPFPAPPVPWPDTEAYDYVYPTPLAGSQAGLAQPLSVALVLQLRTIAPGRTGRGRLFSGAVPPSFCTASAVAVPVPVSITNLETLLPQAIYTVVGTGSQYKLQVVSRRIGVANDVTFVGHNPYLRSQRRREIGVGS